jgi:hypothetical protein
MSISSSMGDILLLFAYSTLNTIVCYVVLQVLGCNMPRNIALICVPSFIHKTKIIDEHVKESFDYNISQSINQSINQINRSINQSINQSVFREMYNVKLSNTSSKFLIKLIVHLLPNKPTITVRL